MTGDRRVVAGVVAIALALSLTACGSGSAGGLGWHQTASRPSSTAAQAAPFPSPTTSMAHMPPGTQLSLVHPGQLTVCSLEATPFLSEGYGQDKETGFDADLLSLLGQRISAVPFVSSITPAQIFSAQPLSRRACDVIAGGAVAMPDQGDASSAYFKDSYAILSLAAKPYTSLEALSGKRVVGSEGAADFIKSYNSQHGTNIQVQLTSQGTDTERFMIESHAVDAAIVGYGAALHTARQAKDMHVVQVGQIDDLVYIVRHGNGALLAQINAALLDAAGNGQYAYAYYNTFGNRPSWQPGQN